MMLDPIVHPLHADDGGAGGPAVVFLHSLAGNTTQWAAQLACLRPRRRAVALDWRGHGRSGTPPGGGFAIPGLAADVMAAADRLRLGRFVLVAHNSGAIVALACAAACPDRILGLLLVDPVGDLRQVPSEMLDPFLAALASDGYGTAIEGWWRSILAGADPFVAERVMADLRATPPETVVGVVRALRQYDPVTALKRYPGPVLSVVTRFNDAPFSLRNLSPGLRHTRVEGTSHWLQMDRPDAFNAVLGGFLADVEDGPRSEVA
ncbi:MAG TPA: alpha/beta hydrolase [Alphaproteobacteria bacterium]|nr:alpha/beta hydrolase [Alphaproteobacteria bacterium]